MPRLYVANCTPQHRVFSYRLLGTARILQWDIRAGEQEIASGDLSREQLDDAIGQNERYGLVAAASVSQARDYVNTLWSIDKPVTGAQMKQALDRNLFLKEEEGRKTRAAVAVGVTEVVQREHPNSYEGLRVSLRDARRDTELDLNEIHTHRKDGQYERGTDFEAPLKRPASRRRRAA